MIRIHDALKARRAQLQNDQDKGFTLIELLVVVIIIGVLAAIAVPIYIGLQNSAKDAAVKSDLTNAKIAIVAFSVDNPTGTVAIAADGTTTPDISEYGFTTSEYTTWTAVTIDPDSTTGWTLVATSDTTESFQITDVSEVTDVPAP